MSEQHDANRAAWLAGEIADMAKRRKLGEISQNERFVLLSEGVPLEFLPPPILDFEEQMMVDPNLVEDWASSGHHKALALMIFDMSPHPQVRALGETVASLQMPTADRVRLVNALDALVADLTSPPPHRRAGSGYRSARIVALQVEESHLRRFLEPADIRRLADNEKLARPGGTKESRFKQLSSLYREIRPGLPKASARRQRKPPP